MLLVVKRGIPVNRWALVSPLRSVTGNTEVQIDRQIAVIRSSRTPTAVWSRIRSKG